ncbi:ubiquitin carboxyl-terminal hydrolase 25 [Gastrolobium bilobum]|uniref:ubiquitin carboxyl-terminal hydrolase 25 n=1 Tax=Gastrolobium bilobum TaxID=150636 RepID=UPI002AB046D6|nr:ubiquitin carboxyl-terminal hydrolase 25 [Gastrolobium bilobum]
MALQMTWQPSLLSQKRKTGPPLGLRNLGNSCYLNSVLQCLTYTPPLANFCLRFQHSSLCDSSASSCPFCILEKQIARSLRVDLPHDAPSKIQSCLRIFAEHFRCGRQEDAHEFLRYVIDACHNTCLRLKKLRRKDTAIGTSASGAAGGSTVVKEIFGGALQSQVKCLCCGYESNKVDEIMDISLDVFHSNSLRDSMQKFFQPEVLDGNNKYKCDNCKKLVPAKKQMSILQAPNVLVIQLKRFEGILGVKIDKAVAFEEVLVLSSFMAKASQDPQPEYKLFGTIVHSGYSPESGHYYSYIKDAMGRWYCCDDSCVTVATLQEVLSEKVYILFFSRTNQRPVPNGNSRASNGVKPHHSNGSEASECPKVDVPPKTVHAKSNSEQSAWKDMPCVSKIGKVPSSSRVKFDINGSSTSKRIPAPASVNGKVDISKNQSLAINGYVKDSVSLENGKKEPSSLPTENGFHKTKVAVADNSKRKESSLTNGYSDIQTVDMHSVKSDPPEDTDRSRVITGRGPDNFKQESNGINSQPKLLGNKRKIREVPCILLAQDGQSRARVQEMKDDLGKEAKSTLKSCGWTDMVYDFMRSRKRLRAQEAGNLASGDQTRKLLIGDAKEAFISQIPESLRKDLIERLRTFSQEKVQFEGP